MGNRLDGVSELVNRIFSSFDETLADALVS